jgi:NAD-dependent dihydropyrimidine dehydrogenase PreA subunit
LNQFSSIVEGKNQYRFALIQDLHFQVVLDEYSCKDCRVPESKALHARQVASQVLVSRRY